MLGSMQKNLDATASWRWKHEPQHCRIYLNYSANQSPQKQVASSVLAGREGSIRLD